MTNDNETKRGVTTGYASSPCMWHEFAEDQSQSSLDEPRQPIDVARWRRAERKKHLDARSTMDFDLRARSASRIAQQIEQAIGRIDGLTISLYWPIRGEPDLRPLMERIIASGGACALPVVVERGQPLEFRRWAPGERLERGIWNIPVPADGAAIIPDVVVAPVVAFDRSCYRLGYGGGYFDRTLAAMIERPRVFGVAYSAAEIPTIYPQKHDVPMDAIVTEAGLLRRAVSR